MVVFLTALHIFFCFTLILVILLQAGRGQGLTGPAFGGGNVQTLFGTRAADFLAKATSVAAICFLLTSIGLDWMEVRKSRSLLEGPRQRSSIDVESVERALERIQAESGTKASEQGTPSAEPAGAADKADSASSDENPAGQP